MIPWELLWVLAAVVVVLYLCYLCSRYIASRGGSLVMRPDGGIKAVSRLPLTQDKQLVLVDAGGRFLLLGVSPAGVQLVAELTREEAEACRMQPPGNSGGQPPRFGDILRDSLSGLRRQDKDE